MEWETGVPKEGWHIVVARGSFRDYHVRTAFYVTSDLYREKWRDSDPGQDTYGTNSAPVHNVAAWIKLPDFIFSCKEANDI